MEEQVLMLLPLAKVHRYEKIQRSYFTFQKFLPTSTFLKV